MCFSPDILLHLKHIQALFSMEFYSNSPKFICSSSILKRWLFFLEQQLIFFHPQSLLWIFFSLLGLQPTAFIPSKCFLSCDLRLQNQVYIHTIHFTNICLQRAEHYCIIIEKGIIGLDIFLLPLPVRILSMFQAYCVDKKQVLLSSRHKTKQKLMKRQASF